MKTTDFLLSLTIATFSGILLGVMESVMRSQMDLPETAIPSIAVVVGTALGLTLSQGTKTSGASYVPLLLANIIAMFTGGVIGLILMA